MTHEMPFEHAERCDKAVEAQKRLSDNSRRNALWSEVEQDAAASSADLDAKDREGLMLRVRLFLATSHIPTLRRVEVEIEGDAVLLRGKVRSYYEKQMALQFASRVAGVIQVIDAIEVHAYMPTRLRRANAPVRCIEAPAN